MYEVEGKVFLVTGGATGIGALTVEYFLDAGAKHVMVLDINTDAGNALKDKLDVKYGVNKMSFRECDITTNELDASFDAAISQFGYIDVVINNAAILDDSPDHFVRSIEINLTSLTRSSMRAYNLMRKDRDGKGGTIINISSVAALTQFSYIPIYSGTKSAILQFSNCLGKEPHYSRSAVRVVTVCFGKTDTPILLRPGTKLDKETDDELLSIISKQPKQRAESAAKGVVEAYKRGASASTWVVSFDRPAEDITSRVTKAYQIMEGDLLT